MECETNEESFLTSNFNLPHEILRAVLKTDFAILRSIQLLIMLGIKGNQSNENARFQCISYRPTQKKLSYMHVI